jgi:hypothetical protein
VILAEPEPLPPPVFAEPVPAEEPISFAEPVAMPVEEAVPLEFAEPTPEPMPSVPPVPAAVPPVPVVDRMSPTTPVPALAPTPAPPVSAPAILPLGTIPAGAQPRLQVLRGQKRNVEYPLYEGLNYIGRADEKPVDIDLEEQEPPDRIWCSRQHAVITFEGSSLSIEDLNSANGTYVNRTRVYPGQQKPLAVNDIVQIGNVQLKVII